jgi:hypothetical protein
MSTLVISREKLLLDKDFVVYGVVPGEFCCYIVESDCKHPQVAFVVY